jgi:hypothetical protein
MLIAKAELFKSMPVISQPVGASIRAIEGVYDVRSSMCCASTQIHANIERSNLLSPLSTTFQVVRRISSLNSELFRKQCSKRSSRTKRWARIDWRNGGKSGAASSPRPCWWSSRTAALQTNSNGFCQPLGQGLSAIPLVSMSTSVELTPRR